MKQPIQSATCNHQSAFLQIAVIFILFFIYSLIHSLCLAQTYWLQKAGSASIDEGTDVSKDANGNIYSTGYFTGTADFDTVPGNITLTSSGSTDVFLAKYNPQGILQWAVKAGGNLPDKGFAIKTDAQGNSYITGFFFGTATFGSTTVTASGNSQDVFIAKYNTGGNLLWVKTAGGNNGDIGNGITVDNTGNVFVSGEFSGTAQFGSFTLTSMLNPNTLLPSIDIFIVKLDLTGNFTWVKQGAAKYTDRGLDIATDISGNVYTTGQFSDTVIFDNTYNNNSFNTIFLTKHDASGNEIWFRRAGGGIQNIAYGIAVDNSGNIYIAGDAKGNIIFWGNTPTYLNTAYNNNIFVAKYDASGNLIWVTDNGSDSPVSARNIALDDSANAFVIGNFQCVFTEYSNAYGTGIFNSVGYNDIFVSKFSSSGNWLRARQCGGQKEDFGNGITVDNSGLPYLCGSFQQDIFIPANNNFTGYDLDTLFSSSPNFYCNSAFYNLYVSLSSYGNSDIVVGRAIDFNRQPYDYYNRSGTNCNRDYLGVCINYNCPDSINACGNALLTAKTNTSSYVGPSFNYLWSPGGGTNLNNLANQSGVYYVTATTSDGCFSSYDSIYVKINPLPPRPVISDDIVLNNNAVVTQKIQLCEPDSVTLTGGNFSQNNALAWTSTALPSPVYFPSVTVDTSGYYIFSVTDSNGCINSNGVLVEIYPLLPAFDPQIIVIGSSNDSIGLCEGDCFFVQLFDLISNPDTFYLCFPISLPYNAITNWSVVPTIPFTPLCNAIAEFCPANSGEYEINATIVRINICDTDTFYLSKTIYVELYPVPQVNINISYDRTILCPAGDSILLIASGWSEYEWNTPAGIQTGDSIWAYSEGGYSITVSDSNSFGCKTTVTAGVNISVKSQPQIFASPANALLCPDSSVILTVNLNGVNYDWFGPSGQIPSAGQSITVYSPGYYLCLVTDSDSCVLTSNTIEVKEYATPFLTVTPRDTVCPGEAATLTVITNPGSILQWEPPLSGSALFQIVNITGIYTCNVSSCGVITPVSTYITASNTVFQLTVNGSTTFCDWDSVKLTTTPGLISYQWSTGDSATDFIVVNQTGDYSVTAVDSFGCIFYSDTISMNALASPSPPVTDNATICKGNFAILSANGAGTMEWFDVFSGGNPIATGNTFATPVINSETQFFVQANDGSACPGMRIPVTVFVDSISMLPVELTADNYSLVFGDSTQLTAVCNCEPPDFSWSPSSALNDANSMNPVASPLETTTYVFQISDAVNSSCTASDTITIEVKKLTCGEPEIFVPNAFTPNNDNRNDVIFVRGKKVQTMHFVIVDRWGEKIFETENQSNGWDGTYKGKKCDPAVFVYHVTGICIDGQELFMKGNITLIR